MSLRTMEFNGGCSKKTYEKWYIRPQDPAKRWGFTDEAAKCIQEKVVTKEKFEDTRNDERRHLNLLKSPAEYSVTDLSNLNRFLNEILISEAKFPDSAEAKQIFEEMDNMVAMMCQSLQEKLSFFQGCTAKRVGSTAEKLKTGKPDEFDYNIILPNVAGSVAFLQDMCNNSLNGEVNKTFFRKLENIDCDRISNIYFEFQDMKIFEGIVSQDEINALYFREIQNVVNFEHRLHEVWQEGEIMQSLI